VRLVCLVTDPLVSLVVPVHNEAPTIGASVAAWLEAFDRMGISAECVVVDDGSVDATPDVLAAAAGADSRLRVIRQVQAGHGAAVTTAYRAARGTWVVQIDGDDEIGVEYFAPLWSQRADDGLVLGRRDPSTRAWVRRLISAGAAVYVRVTTGARIADANVPYRLLPRRLLQSFLDALPAGTFAPNLVMTMYAGLNGWPIREVPVVERTRVATRRPLGGTRLWRAVFRTLQQSLRFVREWPRHRPRA
jgi:glycosyltransferase involved in cell wall biosynthesis